jgi:molybdate transport system substrate-binding protein
MIVPVRAAEVNVYAASSLTDALKEIAAAYKTETGVRVSFNFAASSLLARQIEEGAPADLFFSADEAKMDALQKAGLVRAETRRDLLSNSLVIVASSESKHRVADLLQADKIVLADPRAVPAGIYTREYLTKAGFWEKLQPKLVPTENVRSALAAVESGNADVGFVYKTDAQISPKAQVIFEIPAENGPAIRYPIAILKQAKELGATAGFLRYLESDSARTVFEKSDFVVRH